MFYKREIGGISHAIHARNQIHLRVFIIAFNCSFTFYYRAENAEIISKTKSMCIDINMCIFAGGWGGNFVLAALRAKTIDFNSSEKSSVSESLLEMLVRTMPDQFCTRNRFLAELLPLEFISMVNFDLNHSNSRGAIIWIKESIPSCDENAFSPKTRNSLCCQKVWEHLRLFSSC